MLVSNGHHSAIFSYASNQLGGQVFSSTESIKHYFLLAETNKQLAEENIYLRSQIKVSYLDRDLKQFDVHFSQTDSLQLNDTITHTADTLTRSFDYISAKVISNSVHKKKNYLMLNKGKNQGITPNMGVIGPYGAVGIVHSVSNDFCTVISLLNTKAHISAKLLENQELGNISWNGNNYQTAQLNSIETYIPIKIGDTIVSSGYSHVFPESVLLGTISDFEKVIGENTYRINVKLSTNFNALNYVTIVRNLYFSEQMDLRTLEEK